MADAVGRPFLRKIQLLLSVLGLLLAVHFVNLQLDGALLRYGVMPRSVQSWYHVFTAPFIHIDFAHLFNNLMALSVFSALCLLRSIRFYLVCSLFIIAFGGGLVWMFGREASHVGASGWVFGLWSLSIALAWFDRRLKNVLLAIFVVLVYGGMVFGVLPSSPQVSFEMHLFGAVAGVVCAFLAAAINRRNGVSL